jgi:hypothetical protein
MGGQLAYREPGRRHTDDRERRLLHFDGLAPYTEPERESPPPVLIADHCNGKRRGAFIVFSEGPAQNGIHSKDPKVAFRDDGAPQDLGWPLTVAVSAFDGCKDAIEGLVAMPELLIGGANEFSDSLAAGSVPEMCSLALTFIRTQEVVVRYWDFALR